MTASTRLAISPAWSASRADDDVGVREIRGWHLARGFSDIGYAYVIRRSGKLESGRPVQAVGAHAIGYNHNSVGICIAGGLDPHGRPEPNYTAAQWDPLAATVRFLQSIYPKARVVGHRDLSPDQNGDGIIQTREWLKACPCFSVEGWVKAGMRSGA